MQPPNLADAPRQRVDLSTLTPGFDDVVHDSQRVFRALLEGLSRPGNRVPIDALLPGARAPESAPLAALAALLALADYSTPVFLQRANRSLSDAVRFHTGAPVTLDAKSAVFAYLHDAADMPPLDTFSIGEPETPEGAATLFIRVESLDSGSRTTWRGPGIQTSVDVRIAGIPDRFWHERTAIAAQFPCGIDCYFVADGALIGLPRTTHVEVN